MSLRCPYCKKKFASVKAIYGHWGWCKEYQEFVRKNGKVARVPFTWIGYRDRKPRDWIVHKKIDKL